MLSRKEFLKEEKECADMLWLTLEEYRKNLKDTKIIKRKESNKKQKYDNSILEFLGLSSKDLKRRKAL